MYAEEINQLHRIQADWKELAKIMRDQRLTVDKILSQAEEEAAQDVVNEIH